MTEENVYEKLTLNMKEALAAAKKLIPPNILSSNKDMHLTREDYRMLGTSLFIEHNYSKRKNSNGDYSGPSTEAQQGFIARLIGERKGSSEATAQFLDTNEKKSCMDLTSSLASTLIDQLKALPKM